MKPVSDKQLVAVARKYNLDLGGLKCRAFALFDQGYSPKEVRYLLRNFRDPQYPQSFSNTIRKYYFLWRKAQLINQPDAS